jgi:hypothetical protein
MVLPIVTADECHETSEWTPACWEWQVADLSHLHDIDEFDHEGFLELALREWQAGRCAMCGRSADLRLDHDHKTGMVRGLLSRRKWARLQ